MYRLEVDGSLWPPDGMIYSQNSNRQAAGEGRGYDLQPGVITAGAFEVSRASFDVSAAIENFTIENNHQAIRAASIDGTLAAVRIDLQRSAQRLEEVHTELDEVRLRLAALAQLL